MVTIAQLVACGILPTQALAPRPQSGSLGNGDSRINAGLDSHVGDADRNAVVLCCCGHAWKDQIANRDADGRSPVLGLLLRGGPSTVTRLVVAVVVWVPVYRHPGWARPHVGEERFKRGIPALTNEDSSPAPVREVFVLRVGAAPLYCEPRSVLAGLAASALVPMARHGGRALRDGFRIGPVLTGKFAGKTSARADGPVSKVPASDELGRAAVASAVPHLRRGVLVNHEKPAEALAGYVN